MSKLSPASLISEMSAVLVSASRLTRMVWCLPILTGRVAGEAFGSTIVKPTFGQARGAAASSRDFDAHRLQEFLAARGVEADVEVVKEGGDAAGLLLAASRAAGANLLVSGAFGHPRLREFIFGGTTRTFLHADSPSLFLSH